MPRLPPLLLPIRQFLHELRDFFIFAWRSYWHPDDGSSVSSPRYENHQFLETQELVLRDAKTSYRVKGDIRSSVLGHWKMLPELAPIGLPGKDEIRLVVGKLLQDLTQTPTTLKSRIICPAGRSSRTGSAGALSFIVVSLMNIVQLVCC